MAGSLGHAGLSGAKFGASLGFEIAMYRASIGV